MTPRPILAAALFAALTPAVALGTVGAAFVMWIGDVNRAKSAANARTRVYCDAEPLHFDDETCPRCDDHPPLSWELAKTKRVRDMTLIESAAWLATARDIDGLGAYVEREWAR